jgi:hypothetical protein
MARPGPSAAPLPGGALSPTPDPVAVVLVEGVSDQIAVEVSATRRGLDLQRSHVAVVPMGGAGGLRRALAESVSPTARVVTLCDAGERALVERDIAASGRRVSLFVCDPDLEAELIRAIGVERAVDVLDEHGDGRAFATLQKQPGWRGGPVESQLHRFIGAGARRKARYARLLTEVAADVGRTPRALIDVVDAARDAVGGDLR